MQGPSRSENKLLNSVKSVSIQCALGVMFQCKVSARNSAISVQSQPIISANVDAASVQFYLCQASGKLLNSAESARKQGIISYKTVCPKYLNEVGAKDQLVH